MYKKVEHFILIDISNTVKELMLIKLLDKIKLKVSYEYKYAIIL